MKNAIKVICFVLVVLIAGIGGGYVYFTWDVGEFVTFEGSKAGTVIITDYIGDATDVVIPNRLRGKKVISIDDNAFKNKNITSVKFNDNIISIGVNSFQNCDKLTKVDMGTSLENIGNSAFSNCPELTEVIFSPTVKKLGHVIFGNDAKLTDIDLNGNENFKFSDGVLYSADMTKIYETLFSADLSDYVMPKTVVELNSFAFYAHDEITSLNINSGIKIINEGTFVDCKGLKEITFPDSVVGIGTAIVAGSGIETIKIPASVQNIDKDAFFKSEEGITIVTTKGSYAAKFAEKNDLKLMLVDNL